MKPTPLAEVPWRSEVGRGVRVCRRITKQYARTFYFASHGLPRAIRAHAYAVYGFCRWVDNAVDDAATVEEASARLEHAREVLDLAYCDHPAPPGLCAFRHTVRARRIPRELFDDLLTGMEMDLTLQRYADFEALDLYCYRVAGVVGLMMTHLFGYRDARCFPHAVALGRAMQLTNILRDIAEDLGRGRIYLPQDELTHFGVSEDQLSRGLLDERFRELMDFQIARARQAYRQAELGIRDLDGLAAQFTVRVMGRLYEGILDVIEQRQGDVFAQRAFVPTSRKLILLTRCARQTWRS